MKREKALEILIVISTGFIVLFFILKFKWLLLIALAISLIAISSDYLSLKIASLWLMLSRGLGFITSGILLTMVFFLFLLPLAIISRFFRKEDAFQLKKKRGESYFYIIDKIFTPEDLENMW